MNTTRSRTPRKRINRVIEKKDVTTKRNKTIFAVDKYSWESYYAERNYYYGDDNETGTDK